jgi:hypothetical protein
MVRVFNTGTKEVYSLTISLLYKLSRCEVRGVPITSTNKRNRVLKSIKVLIISIISY